MATKKKSTKKTSKKSTPAKKKLTRSNDRMLFGVCSGIGDYINIDGTIIRLGWILATAFTGFVPGLIAYIIAAFVIPEE